MKLVDGDWECDHGHKYEGENIGTTSRGGVYCRACRVARNKTVAQQRLKKQYDHKRACGRWAETHEG